MSTNINGAYKKGLGKIREGLLICQGIDKQRNLDAFLERQKRIKERKSQAKNTGNPIAATATTNSDVNENEGVNHV
mgnify:CR=1 FL=1